MRGSPPNAPLKTTRLTLPSCLRRRNSSVTFSVRPSRHSRPTAIADPPPRPRSDHRPSAVPVRSPRRTSKAGTPVAVLLYSNSVVPRHFDSLAADIQRLFVPLGGSPPAVHVHIDLTVSPPRHQLVQKLVTSARCVLYLLARE